MKRKKRVRKPELRTTLKLSDDVNDGVRKFEQSTGWGFSACVTFLCRAGIDALYGHGKGIDAMRGVLSASIDARDAQRMAENLVAAERQKLNAAKKAMHDQAVPPAEIPDRPPNAPIIISPKRKPGRPRKSPVPPAGASGGPDVSEAGQGSENAPAARG